MRAIPERGEVDPARNIFDHYVFTGGEEVASHVPKARCGVLGDINPDLAKQIRAFLKDQLS